MIFKWWKEKFLYSTSWTSQKSKKLYNYLKPVNDWCKNNNSRINAYLYHEKHSINSEDYITVNNISFTICSSKWHGWCTTSWRWYSCTTNNRKNISVLQIKNCILLGYYNRIKLVQIYETFLKISLPIKNYREITVVKIPIRPIIHCQVI
jgi:hypothetical protein